MHDAPRPGSIPAASEEQIEAVIKLVIDWSAADYRAIKALQNGRPHEALESAANVAMGELRRALHALAAPKAEGWRPIETAPEGVWILVRGATSRTNADVLVVRRFAGEWWESADDGYGAHIEPTHWMPRPPAPTSPALHDVSDRKGTGTAGPWEDAHGEPLQDDAEAALRWIASRAAAPQPAAAEPAPGVTAVIHESEPDFVHATLTAPRPTEYTLEATREEDKDWYITVTAENGMRDYMGYWKESAHKTVAEVLVEAARGAGLGSLTPPAPVEQPAAAEPATPDHTLKTDPEVFQAVFDGRKTFEIRLNDRGFKVGDWLLLRETTHTGAEIRAGAPLAYTGRELMRCVTHVLTGYGLTDGWCCLSLAATSVEQPAAAEHVVDANKMVRPDHLVDLNKMFPPDFNALIGWLADEAHAAIRAAYPAVRTESLDRAVQSYFEAMQPAASTVPAGYVSAEQLAAHQDPEGDEPFGRYLPVRKTPAGKFTQPIYTAAPAVVGTVPAGWTDDQMVRFAPYARTGVLSGLTDEARLGVFRQDEEKRGIAAPAAVEREALTDEALKRRGDDCLLLESGWTRTVGVRTAFEIGFRDAERAHGIGSSKEGGDAA